MNIKANKSFIYSCVLVALTFIITIRPMIFSTYTSVSNNSIIYYLCTFLPIVVLFVVTSHYDKNAFPSICCALAAVLTLGNASAMPLLRYTSAYDVDNVLAYSKSLCINSLITVGLIPVVWGVVWVCKRFNEVRKNRKWLCIGYVGISCLLVFAILFMTNEDSGTTLIQLSGMSVQVALPAMMLSIIGIAMLWHIDNKVMSGVMLGGIMVINIALFFKGETGIPILTVLSFSLWYYLLQPIKYRTLSIAIPIVSGTSIVAILVLHILTPLLPESGLIHALSDKIERRIFSGSVDQVDRALKSIQTGGFWGSNGYNINVPEASSDFCLSTILHYSGLIFLIVLLAVVIPMFYSACKYYINQKHDFSLEIGSISLATIFIMIFYNILMCSGYLPVLGTQIPFTGVSLSYSILSAFLLGTITYSNQTMLLIIEKMKRGLNRA